MSSETDQPPPFAVPRPGVVTTLGVLNTLFAVMILIGLVFEVFWLYAVYRTATVLAVPGAAPSANTSGVAVFGMNDPGFLRFTLVDAVTGLVLNLAMLASGIGLINQKRWGARLWAWTAWIKIVRLVLLWGFAYVVLVTPSFSENMARAVTTTVTPRIGARGGPTPGDLTRAYAIMNLILGVGMVVFGAVYPAISLWILGRPGVKAALVPEVTKEPGLT